MESTSWNGPDVWHLSWHGPAVPALAQTLTFPWPEHSAQLNFEAHCSKLPPHMVPLQHSVSRALLSQPLGLATCQRLCVLFRSVLELTVLLTLRFSSSKTLSKPSSRHSGPGCQSCLLITLLLVKKSKVLVPKCQSTDLYRLLYFSMDG